MWNVIWAWTPPVIALTSVVVSFWAFRTSKRTHKIIMMLHGVIEQQDVTIAVLHRENRELRRVAVELHGGEAAAIAKLVQPYRFVPN